MGSNVCVIFEDIIKTPERQAANKKKFFFVCEEAAGDVIGATKALDALKRDYPNIPIDFMTKNRFKDIVTGNPHINKVIDWDINKIFDYPRENVFYPHAKIRHGSWSNGFTHLLDMQSEMIGLIPGDQFIIIKFKSNT